jgi:hypothetical protein
LAVAVEPLFTALVDDAGLFPPEQLAMPEAVARHRADVRRRHPVLTQRFLCPASRLGELREGLEPDESWDLGLILDGPPEMLPGALKEIATDPRLHLATVELRVPVGDDPAESVHRVVAASADVPPGAGIYAELGLSWLGWREALGLLARRGLGAKVRCGGIEAHLFPSVQQLASFIVAAVEAGVPFKATAGLHHAVRYVDPATGFDHHGFLNVMVAVSRAVSGASIQDVEAALREHDGEVLATQARAVDEASAARARDRFVAYGSCSTVDPVTDLAALGLVPTEDS